jgi:hypothetical protein
MRKNYKRKRRSCALCKPHKVGCDKRWKVKEAARRMDMEHECKLRGTISADA